MIKIISFSYKTKPDLTGYEVFDCRHLPNPHHVPAFRNKNGLALDVRVWIACEGERPVSAIISHALDHARRGHNIAFGCVGGRHRSVAMAEELKDCLPRETDYTVTHLALTGAPQ